VGGGGKSEWETARCKAHQGMAVTTQKVVGYQDGKGERGIDNV